MPSRRRAFTLVELLVVIGIIAVLIAILIPALSGAREHANRVKCLATLRTMGQAAQMHAQEHRGYMPLAGMFPTAIYPDYLGDPARTKYTYFKDGSRDDGGPALAPAPLSASLGQYLGLPVTLGTRQQLQDSLRSEAVFRHFSCPGDPEPQTGSTIVCAAGWRGPDERMSYLYNMKVLGFDLTNTEPGLVGYFAKVKRPAEVFLFADGQGGRPPQNRWALFGVFEGDTLFDYWTVHGRPGGAFPNLDPKRHGNRINVMYVDGHGETLTLPPSRGSINHMVDNGGIASVGVNLGIYK
jgi:prepilin-type N-terminal cleavage/methylation domain-containing protein/prepilin-type processing-associated H-X9-DG protein